MSKRSPDEELKKLYKEALEEWLDRKFSEVGRWTLRGIVALILVGIAYFVLWKAGWQPPVP